MPAAQPPDDQRKRESETIERYRVRARYFAGLTGTGAAAVSAGLVFGSSAQSIPRMAYLFGVGAAALLLASVASYAVAQNVTGAPKIPKSERDDPATNTLFLIHRATRFGTILGGLAVASLVLMLVASAFERAPSTVGGQFVLSSASLFDARRTCPTLANPVRAKVSSGELADGRGWIALDVGHCMPLGADHVQINVARKGLVAWVLDD